MSATKKTTVVEEETAQVVNNFNTTITINVNQGGNVTIQSEPKENPPKPPGNPWAGYFSFYQPY